MSFGASPPKERAARESRSPQTNGLTEFNHVSRNGSNGAVHAATEIAPDGNRVAQELTQERIVLGGILNYGFGPIDEAGIDLRAEDFSNPVFGETLCYLRTTPNQWQHGYRSLVDIHNQLDKAGLATRLGQGSAGVNDLMTAGDVGAETLKHRAHELVDVSIERQRRAACISYLNQQITYSQRAEFEAELLRRSGDASRQALPPILTLGELDAAYPDDPPLLIAGPDAEHERDGAVLALGEVGILGSGSKLGKTWAVIDSALAVATGRSWMSHFNCKAGRVLYVNMELGGRAFIRRTEMLMAKRGLKASEIMPNIGVWQLRNARIGAIEEIGKELARRGEQFDLVILDPLYKLLGNREENSNGDMGELMQVIRERFCNGDKTAVLIVHHFPKGDLTKRAALDRFAGAGAIARDADTLITITPEGETFRLEYTTRDYKAGVPMELKMDFPVVDVVGPAEVSNPKAKAQANHNLLRDLVKAESGMDKAALVKKFMAETGCGKSMAYKAIDKSERAKAISRTTLEKTYVAA
jgi:hypothetical protein